MSKRSLRPFGWRCGRSAALVPIMALMLALPALPPSLAAATSIPGGELAQAAPETGPEKRPDAARALFLKDTRAARAALYPGYDEATMQAGESFTSPSLKLEAPDMVLRDFNLRAVSGSSRFIAAALLKPLGFPQSYGLLEVALLQRAAHGGFELQKNLKVRIDSGTGSGDLLMQLGPVSLAAPATIRFDVIVTEDGSKLRHRFRHDGKRLVLIDSVGVN